MLAIGISSPQLISKEDFALNEYVYQVACERTRTREFPGVWLKLMGEVGRRLFLLWDRVNEPLALKGSFEWYDDFYSVGLFTAGSGLAGGLCCCCCCCCCGGRNLATTFARPWWQSLQ